MAYTIVKSDGTVLTTIADGTINTTSSTLGLPGRNYAGYGQTLDTNFVHLSENFASSTPPANPLRGQLWYNTNANTLYVCPADGTSDALSWTALAMSGGNATSTFGAINVTGNVTGNNITAVNGLYADSITVTTATVQANASIANAAITSATVGTLTSQAITSGSATTPATVTGTWTVSGGGSANGIGGTSLWVTNGNLVVTGGSSIGIKTDNYYYANGAPINFSGSYSNSNAASYLPTYGGAILAGTITSPALTTGANTTAGTLTGNWTLSSGSRLNGTIIQATTLTAGSTSITGNLIGNWNLTSGSQFNAASITSLALTTGSNTTNGVLTGTWTLNGGGTANSVNGTSMWVTNGNLVISGVGSPGIRTDNYYYANGTPISFTGTYSNSNVQSYLPTYNGTINTTVVTTGSNVAGGTLTGAWVLSTGSTLNAPLLTSTSISTGANTTTGTLTGTWTLNGGGTANSVSGTSMWITNGNLSISGGTGVGIKTDNYYYANGAPISFAGSYSNSNVANYLPTFTGTVGATNLTTGANTTGGTLTGTWTLNGGGIAAGQAGTSVAVINGNIVVSGSYGIKTDNYYYANGAAISFAGSYSNSNVASYLPTYTGTVGTGAATFQGTTYTTGANTTQGSLVGTWTVNGGGTANGSSGTSMWVTNGNLTITGGAGVGIKTDNYYYANGVAINFSGSYSNSNVASYLPTYTGTVGTGAATHQGTTFTTGANVTAGALTGTWTVNGGGSANSVSGTSMWVTNGNIVVSGGTGVGIKTDNYYYANGVAISFAGSYSNSNVANYLPTFTGTVGATAITTGANTTGGTMTGTWTVIGGGFANSVSGTSLWVTNGNLVVSGGSNAGIKTDNYYYANGAAVNFGTQYSNSNVASYLPTFTGTVGATSLTTGANTTSGTIIGNWSLSAGSKLSATYADLAERYEADAVYDVGTVVELGGEKEITAAKEDASSEVFGVISDSYAYLMNSEAGSAATHPAVALVGRVKIKVSGQVRKGQRLVSAGNGVARGAKDGEATAFNVVGRALVNKTTDGVEAIEATVVIR